MCLSSKVVRASLVGRKDPVRPQHDCRESRVYCDLVHCLELPVVGSFVELDRIIQR